MRNAWIKERLRALKPKGKNGKGLADALDVAPARITEIIKGEREVHAREVSALARYLEMGTFRVMKLLHPDREATHEQVGDLTPVMVIGAVQAGAWHEAIEWDESERYTARISAEPRFAHVPQYGLEVRGPSMNEIYPEGSVVICVKIHDLGRDPLPPERVVCQRRSEMGFEATVKELRRDALGEFWLWPRSNDPNFQQPWKLPKPNEHDHNDDIQIVALVVGMYRPEPIAI